MLRYSRAHRQKASAAYSVDDKTSGLKFEKVPTGSTGAGIEPSLFRKMKFSFFFIRSRIESIRRSFSYGHKCGTSVTLHDNTSFTRFLLNHRVESTISCASGLQEKKVFEQVCGEQMLQASTFFFHCSR